MATRLAVYSSAGQIVGRCDARCHDSKNKRCVCICGGRYHGHGEDILAVDMTEEDLTDELDAFATRNQYKIENLVVKVAPSVQLRLFPVEPRRRQQTQVAA
jgi:dihydroorotase